MNFICNYFTDKVNYFIEINNFNLRLKNWIQNVNIWRKSGIPGPFPLPLVGNLPSLIKRGINKHHCDMAKEYGKTILFFEAMNPVVLTSDPELIKAITIRDFHIFDGRNVIYFLIYLAIEFLIIIRN